MLAKELKHIISNRIRTEITFVSTEKLDIKEGTHMEFSKQIPCNKWNWIKIRYCHLWWMRLIIRLFPIKMKDIKTRFIVHDCTISEVDSYGLKTYEYTIGTKE